MPTLMAPSNKSFSKVLFLLSLYMVQLFCYQALIVASSGTHRESISKSFSPTEQDQTNNSVISVFRTLEKHPEPKDKHIAVKKALVLASEFTSALISSTMPKPLTGLEHALPLSLSDISYRVYLAIGVFRI